MQTTPRNLRLPIGLFGRRNVGKSSLLNAVTRQDVAIVSATPGTTTDPVEKPMELLPLGPVVFIDTAGVDDIGALGEATVTALVSVLGYDGAGDILAYARERGLKIQEAAIDGRFVTPEQFDELTGPEAVCRLGSPSRGGRP